MLIEGFMHKIARNACSYNNDSHNYMLYLDKTSPRSVVHIIINFAFSPPFLGLELCHVEFGLNPRGMGWAS
jgi:hypothetical protein